MEEANFAQHAGTETLPCPRDGHPMKLVLSQPKVGSLPELRTYRCEKCGHVETIADD
jgi:hypothetical protein